MVASWRTVFFNCTERRMYQLKYEAKAIGRYSIVGLCNTILGYGLMFTLMFIGLNPGISNFISYLLGSIFSFNMNRRFVFHSNNTFYKKSSKQGIRFFLTLFCAYIVNIVILYIALFFGVNRYLSQCISGAVYSLLVYLFSRLWVF